MNLNEIQALFKRDGANYICPVHGDTKGSLSINGGENSVLMHCFAGCSTEEICEKVGITIKDLYYNSGSYENKSNANNYSDFSEALNYYIYGFKTHGNTLDRWHKYQSDSEANYLKLIFRQNGEKLFAWWNLTADKKAGKGELKTSGINLYNQADLKTGGDVYIAEGEKDTDTLKSLGFAAVSHYAGANGSFKNYADIFKDKNVFIIYDNDNAGKNGALKTYSSIKKTAGNVSVLDLCDIWTDAPEKADITDYFQEFGKEKSIEAVNKMTESIKEKIQADKAKINKISDCYGVMDDEKLTIAGTAFHLEQTGITVRYNEITRKSDIKGLDKFNVGYIADNFPIIIYNQLNLRYKKCIKSDVQDFLKVIMLNNAYNPVLEMIESGIWDGIDRLPELFRIMRISHEDKLSVTLIYKWLWQNLSMLRNFNGEFGADGVLTLQGSQGIGKTSFALKMSLKSEFFGEGLLLDVRDKDTIIRAVSCWIGELGEIESTFKSDTSALKAFITRASDKYRLPYGRTSEDLPRRTSFIGTCNSEEYLIDETGNRRYWTVPINERMDLDALEKFDAFQLYLQIDKEVKNNIQGFRLTPEEQAELAERNGRHEKPIKAEWEIRDILYKAEIEKEKFIFEEMTITEFKELYPVLRNYTVNQIGTALKKSGLLSEQKRVNKIKARYAILPRLANRIEVKDFL